MKRFERKWIEELRAVDLRLKLPLNLALTLSETLAPTLTLTLTLLLTLISLTPTAVARASPPLPESTSRLVELVTDGFTALCLTQDKRGFLWCGTNRGLFCYDGYTVEFLRHDEGDTSTLSENQVNALAVDGEGNIWVGTSLGLDRLNPVTRRVQRVPLLPLANEESGQVFVTSLLIDSNRTVWVGTQEHGLLEMRHETSAGRETVVVRQHLHDPGNHSSLSHNHVHALWGPDRGNGGFLFVGTSCGLNLVRKGTGVCTRYFHSPADSTSILHDEIWAIVAGDSVEVWIGTGAGVCKLRYGNGDALQCERLPLTIESPVFTLARDQEGDLWLGTHESTIMRYHVESGRIQQQSLEREFYGRRYGNAVYSSLCDTHGAVWFGLHYGLARYDPMRKPFDFVPLSPPPDRWLLETTAFCEDGEGDLWVATSARGLFRYGIGNGDTVNYWHRESDPKSLCWNEVNALLKDRSGAIWIGTANGLDRYERTTDSFRHFTVHDSKERGRQASAGHCVYALLEDRNGSIWVATNSGLSNIDPSTMKATQCLHDGEMMELGFFVGAMVQPKWWGDGSLLLGSRGLYRFYPSNGRLEPYRHVHDVPASHVDHMISGLTTDRTGNVWVSTYSGLHFLGIDGSFRHFSSPGELPSNLICQSVEDQEGIIWISTAGSGVVRFDPETNACRTFEMEEGFLKNTFCNRGAYRSASGAIFLGAPNGFLKFDPPRILDNPLVPEVRITGMRVFDRPITNDLPYEKCGDLVFSHTANMVSFEFVGLMYTDARETQYAYMLEGLSQDWLHCGTQRTATFTNLDPGTYVFRVKAANADGVWNTEGASVRIVIDPPFWQTWWCRGLVLILVGLAFYGGFRYRVEKIVAVERLRLRIANDLHDDIGSDLSSLALESDLLARRLPDGDPGQERLRAVGRTMRIAADNLRDVVWIVSPDQDRIQDLVERMREVAAKMLTGIQYEFRCAGSLLSGPLEIEFKRHVLMIFKETLHNVVRHAHASRVDVEFELNPGHMRMEVRDDGIGFDPSGKQSGRGLRSLQARASAIGGKLAVESTPGKGTTVALEADITRL